LPALDPSRQILINFFVQGASVKGYLHALQTQRWDDHRYYHHNRINQSLHLLSALTFVLAYVWLLIDPVVSALLAWLVSMTTRQIGHFFFEPHDYDIVNQATHAHKEDIKVGYNLRRKVVLMALWACHRCWYGPIRRCWVRWMRTRAGKASYATSAPCGWHLDWVDCCFAQRNWYCNKTQ